MGLGAIIGGVASIGSALISSSASSDASAAASAAADKNNAIQQEVRGQNTANLSPFMARGNAAGDARNNLLGLGTDPTGAANAFNTYRGSDGYQFRVGQGVNALNTGYAAHGALDSGAAMKAIDTYGQGMASDEFGKYMGYLGDQQNVGLSGANALAGVNTNFANSTSSNNNNAAGAAGNAAISSANAINGGMNNFAKIFGQQQGSASSYGGNGGGGFTNSQGQGLVDQTTQMLNAENYNPFTGSGG